MRGADADKNDSPDRRAAFWLEVAAAGAAEKAERAFLEHLEILLPAAFPARSTLPGRRDRHSVRTVRRRRAMLCLHPSRSGPDGRGKTVRSAPPAAVAVGGGTWLHEPAVQPLPRSGMQALV